MNKRSASGVVLCLLLMIGLTGQISAGEELDIQAKTSDGRSVILHSDGSWEYIDDKRKKILEVRTVANIIDELRLVMDLPVVFFGCVVDMYIDQKEFSKDPIVTVTVGDQKKRIKAHIVGEVYEDDPDAPKLGDCRIFRSEDRIDFHREPGVQIGTAWEVRILSLSSDYEPKIVDKALTGPVYKDNLTVDEYYNGNIQYGGREVYLTGIVSDHYYQDVSEIYYFQLRGVEGLAYHLVMASFSRERWEDNAAFKKMITEDQISDGDIVKVYGRFGDEVGMKGVFLMVKELVEINGRKLAD